MVCDTRLRQGQTISQRADEVRQVVERLNRALTSGSVRALVNRQNGGISFPGLTDAERNGVTDGCLLRRLMATGSALAKQKIAAAEQAAGRSIDKTAIAQGLHTHDGKSWHKH